jgi:hypothetical protein
MHAKLMDYTDWNAPRVMAVIRVVDGALQIEGDLQPNHQHHLEQEFRIFKERIDPTGNAETFLKERLPFVFAGIKLIKPRFVAEG